MLSNRKGAEVAKCTEATYTKYRRQKGSASGVSEYLRHREGEVVGGGKEAMGIRHADGTCEVTVDGVTKYYNLKA